MNNGQHNGDEASGNGRDNRGKFKAGCAGGPGRPARRRLTDDPEFRKLDEDLREAGERMTRLLAEISTGVLSDYEARSALRTHRIACGKNLHAVRAFERRYR